MRKSLSIIFYLCTVVLIGCKEKETNAILLVNHTGYEISGLKKVVLQTQSDYIPKSFEVLATNDEVVFKGNFNEGGKIDNWHTGNAFAGDFSKFNSEGDYYLRTDLNGSIIKSRVFTIDNSTFAQKSLSLLIEGFETQHLSGDFNEKDAEMTFFW